VVRSRESTPPRRRCRTPQRPTAAARQTLVGRTPRHQSGPQTPPERPLLVREPCRRRRLPSDECEEALDDAALTEGDCNCFIRCGLWFHPILDDNFFPSISLLSE
jgi:hypothetical protein